LKLKYYNINRRKVQRILILFTLLGLFTFLSIGGNFGKSSPKSNLTSNPNNENLETQDLDSSNTFTGTGEPWNVTHWANRTDYNLAGSFSNGTTDTLEIPLGLNWEGYQLDSSIYNLYDTRNWNNGTFNFGNDDGTYAAGEDDTAEITNPYQNWTFNSIDGSTLNPMSGNYLDSAYGPTDGHNCLELRMDGNPSVLSGYYNYNENDRCWWNSSFSIPRGQVIDSELNFEINPNHLANFDSWKFAILINGIQVYSIGTDSLKSYGAGSWHSFSLPMGIWVNTTNVFGNPVDSSETSIEMSLEYVADTASYSNGFTNIAYQQIFVDNLELVSKAEAKPSQLQLKLNSTSVNDVDWGVGSVSIGGSWHTSPVTALFSSDDTWDLSGFTIDLVSNLNLFATKALPETSYETNFISEGIKFSVESGNVVNWEAYSYFAVPTSYEETTMKLEFPSDVTITWVSEPQLPSTNRLSLCDTSTPGVLIIPVDTISTTPDGFWKFEATSPNHLNNINTFKNTTLTPGPLDWSPEDIFYSGDYINFTANVNLNPLFSGYITQTQALLQIKFPNGTLWEDKSQYKFCDASGKLYFDYFQIPFSTPDYDVGIYTAIITWNNSYSVFGLNETGIITKTFTVKHYSTLTPDQIYYSNIFEGDTINLIVSFNDIENGDAISGALVYTDNFLGSREYFNEISPGFYVLLDFNTTGGIAGDNLLTIYANSSLYQNNTSTITINLILRTLLTAEEFPFLQVTWNDNFTIHLNYTEVSTGNGIITSPNSNWLGESSTIMISPGVYNMEFNSSLYEVNKIHSLIIDVNEPNYESQSLLIKVEILERETNFDNIFLNGIDRTINKSISLNFGELLNVSFSYNDFFSGRYLSGATARIVGDGVSEVMDENLISHHYEITLNTSILGIGATFLTVSAQLQNYSASSAVLTIYVGERETIISNIYLNGFLKTVDKSITLTSGELLSISFTYNDKVTNQDLSGATARIVGGGVSEVMDENLISHHYEITLNTSTFGVGATFLTISAQLQNYSASSAVLTIYVGERGSTLIVLINGTMYPNNYVKVQVSDTINITVKYTDLITGHFLPNATVELLEYGFFEENNISKQYTYMIDANLLGQGIDVLKVIATKENYQSQPAQITVEITERITSIQLFFDGNESNNAFIELPIGSILNITVKFSDSLGNFVNNANVELFGEGLSFPLIQNIGLEQYSILLDTHQLDIGIRKLSIIANRTNYQLQAINMNLNIRRIMTSISTISGNTTINIRPGQSAEIKVRLSNLDFGGVVLNASVTFRWEGNTITMTDVNNDGIYEYTIQNVAEGTHPITITVSAGDDYDFQRYQITIVATRPSGESLLFLILAIVGGIATAGLLTYLYLYQKVLKYPKPVRKTRKYRKTLQRTKSPSISILSRDKAFEGSYKSNLAKPSKSVIGKSSETPITKDNIIAKKGIE
jgi:hypothetical protein